MYMYNYVLYIYDDYDDDDDDDIYIYNSMCMYVCIYILQVMFNDIPTRFPLVD